MPKRPSKPKTRAANIASSSNDQEEEDVFADSFPEIIDIDDDIQIIETNDSKDSSAILRNSSRVSGTKRNAAKAPSETPAKASKLDALLRAHNQAKIVKSPLLDSKDSLPWVDKHLPSSAEELFVHKKKIQDVRSWMSHAFAAYDENKPPMLSLLTGPTGAGKTATATLLAKEFGAEVKEWVNPMTLTDYVEGSYNSEEVQGRSQLDLFTGFLTKASQYVSLPLKRKQTLSRRLIMVEDFPNMFYRDPDVFHNVLRNYSLNGSAPIVFIVPDNASGECNPLRLFPKHILQELKIVQFTFNAVAPSFMNKFLNVICTRENLSVGPTVMDSVVAVSSGDIRCAINSLQFKVLRENAPPKGGSTFKRPLPKQSKLKKDKMLQTGDLMQKDESLFLFRALGKILYNKRDKTAESEIEQELGSHLLSERRPFKPIENVEEIYSKIEVLTDTFLGFIHQNYTNFFTNVEDCATALSYQCIAEQLTSRWFTHESTSRNFKVQDAKEQMALSIALRGTMHANQGIVTSEWRPLKKPLFGDIEKKVKAHYVNARSLFSPSLGVTSECFYTESVPFIAKSLKRNFKPDQQSLAVELGLFKDAKHYKRPRWGETLDEKGLIEEESSSGSSETEESHQGAKCDSSFLPQAEAASGLLPNPTNVQEADDFLIEEYDD